MANYALSNGTGTFLFACYLISVLCCRVKARGVVFVVGGRNGSGYLCYKHLFPFPIPMTINLECYECYYKDGTLKC